VFREFAAKFTEILGLVQWTAGRGWAGMIQARGVDPRQLTDPANRKLLGSGKKPLQHWGDLQMGLGPPRSKRLEVALPSQGRRTDRSRNSLGLPYADYGPGQSQRLWPKAKPVELRPGKMGREQDHAPPAPSPPFG